MYPVIDFIHFDYIIILKQRINRPASISASQWLDFWESNISTNGYKSVRDLEADVEELENQLRESEREVEYVNEQLYEANQEIDELRKEVVQLESASEQQKQEISELGWQANSDRQGGI